MSGAGEVRLRRASERMMLGLLEALEIVRGAVEAGAEARTDEALADLQDVLEGTLEDARADLGVRDEGGA